MINHKPQHRDLIQLDGGVARKSYALGLHPNEQLFKYYWRVFTETSEEGELFFNEPELSTYDAIMLVDSLEASGKGYILYNRRLPRKCSRSPFDFTHEKWKECEWALPYDEDEDHQWNSHK